MLLIPAIDLKDGRCVRLRQGDMNDATVFSEDPVAMARHWLALGARRLHVVDLNGARSGKPVNEPVIRKIVAAVGEEMPVQLGGGLRDLDIIERYIDDGALPPDNNHIENRIRPIALGRSNWLFAGSLRGGQRAAAAMSLIQSAKLNGHDPYAYLKDVLERLPSHPASRIEELLPHRWSPLALAD